MTQICPVCMSEYTPRCFAPFCSDGRNLLTELPAKVYDEMVVSGMDVSSFVRGEGEGLNRM